MNPTMLEEFTRQQRTKREMAQAYIASELGLSRQTYVRLERGARELTVAEARKLAAIFEMPLGDFLAGHEPVHTVTLAKSAAGKTTGIKIRVSQKNLAKFKQVLLYLLHEVGGKPNIGEAEIHTLLYFIDFDYYEQFEENLMGATYLKGHHGPTAVELKAIFDDMRKQGEVERVILGRGQSKYLPLVRPKLEELSAREIKHIDDVLTRLSDKTAKEMKNHAREDIPWKTAHQGKPLSYESVFYRDEKFSIRNYADEV